MPNTNIMHEPLDVDHFSELLFQLNKGKNRLNFHVPIHFKANKKYLRSMVAVVVKLNSDLARGIFIPELLTTSPNERISKHDASMLFVFRMADSIELRSDSSSKYCPFVGVFKNYEILIPGWWKFHTFSYLVALCEHIVNIGRQKFSWSWNFIPAFNMTWNTIFARCVISDPVFSQRALTFQYESVTATFLCHCLYL